MTQVPAPIISVIMPVYNADMYLKAAIDSILNQTFRDFEFIIINDGSTDKSEVIIRSYTDPRIVYVKNKINLGLITTLNNAIEIAKGKYVARMDSDDISLPERFRLQLSYLNSDAQAKMVCSPIVFMTSGGKDGGSWPADQATHSPELIANKLPWENCLAHPTVLIETEILRKYRFSLNQKGSEDWDLWLRLARDEVKIIKTQEVLLRYRVHSNSFTSVYNRAVSPQIKSAGVKLRFAFKSLAQFRFNFFVIKTILTIYKDLGYYFKTSVLPVYLRTIKWVFTIDPFKAYSQFKKLEKCLATHNSSHFLFFPYSHVGGAEKVHAEITKVIEEHRPFVFFTGLRNKADHIEQFGKKALLLNVEKALYHPFFSKRSEKKILAKINTCNDPVVFGCNNIFFYDILFKLRKDIYVTDLTHDYDYKRLKEFAEKYLPNYLRCNKRIFISNATVKKTLDFYDANFVDDEFKDRIGLIYNYVNIPAIPLTNAKTLPLRLVYVGRDTPEKRVDILFQLAALCAEKRLPCEFVFVGPLKARDTGGSLTNVMLPGVITDEKELSKIYGAAHIVLISSASEGFPLTIMEGMMHGCIPLATDVGDIPFHIKNEVNGFLIHEINEQRVAGAMLDIILRLEKKEFDLEAMSQRCIAYAKEMFAKGTFVSAYKKILKAE